MSEAEASHNPLATPPAKDGLSYQAGSPNKQDFVNELLFWSCSDECSYHCMWRTTNAFISRNWEVPQFYGKWPFKRFLGMQEPASVLFSIFNSLSHCWMIRRFRQFVRKDSPMFYVWHVFFVICFNGWIWSAVFHTRDFPITELCDYSFAYSIVLSACCLMVLRMIHRTSRIVRTSFGIVSLFYFINHFSHLSTGSFDYDYNMKANVATGVISGIGWIIWYIFQRKKRPYAWKILAFQLLAACSLLLELNDFPPVFWTFDAHSLWHLSTAPLTVLLYR
ncbi:Post-GPI attachment to proteins factor 3 [Pseudolycoriella hygida]|uniref:Post-GPI attachment to proteins factor 3 n=1 Tax=Pseudolycoriella hygida TaxID=35572 RepID=A0A9Q0N4E3_9DIPT|nr:Post-GPI attachment to proteins factor 3 [Pseudolycoriella hygida]